MSFHSPGFAAPLHRLVRLAAPAALAVTCAVLLPAHAQSHPSGAQTQVTAPSPAQGPLFSNDSPNDPGQVHLLHTMEKERNSMRQQQIVDDTNQLLDLAKQLKDAVDKSSKDQLSLSVVNTATEIEKLAKSVKEKMRDGQ
jgi:HPt (histidine-containing phosphotransfer) domain-containing protein